LDKRFRNIRAEIGIRMMLKNKETWQKICIHMIKYKEEWGRVVRKK
jgi:hypothetical protein